MVQTISLKVRKSHVERVGGARINDEILLKLGIKTGERVVVIKDEQMIIRKAFGDKAVKKDEIFLRSTAREELNVKDGDTVLVEDYKSLGEAAKVKLSGAKEKIGKGVGKIKKRFRKEDKEGE